MFTNSIIKPNSLICGNCLDVMPQLPNHSIDMILCDLPYGTTACAWDVIIPFDKLWEQYKRIIKPSGATILFGSQPFTSALIMSNPKSFRYEWIWVKNTQTGMMVAGKMPMKKHENILVFYDGQPTFNEQKVLGSETSQNHSKKKYSYENKTSSLYNVDGGVKFEWSEFVHANSVLLCNTVGNRDKSKIHPTQKPVALLEYFIKTYSNEQEVVLDNCMGSGSTIIAAINSNRKYIGIEQNQTYFDKSSLRIENRLVTYTTPHTS